MKDNKLQENEYPFTWLDHVVEVSLNPDKILLTELGDKEIISIKEKLPSEFIMINERLRKQGFYIYKTAQLKVLAGRYDQTIRLLQQKMKINLAQFSKDSLLWDTGSMLLAYLDELNQSVMERYKPYLLPSMPVDNSGPHAIKVLCKLSVDQIGILLKAADHMQLLVARSFSQVLKSIVPYLSTERFTDVSWKSARSSVYKMEESDKEVVIKVLEAMITEVREL